MINKTSIRFLIGIISISLVFISSCKNKESEIGLSLFPNSDKFELKVDTFDVDCYTALDKKRASINRTYSPIGSYHDPIFGYTKTAFISQIKPILKNPKFDLNTKIDSLILEFKSASAFGNKETPQTININRLLIDLNPKEHNFSDFKLKPNEYELIVSTDLNIREDSTIRIKLPIEFAKKLTNLDNISAYESEKSFIEFFKGLYVSTDNIASDGCIFNLSLTTKSTKMTLYFNDNQKYEYGINKNQVRLNLYEHDYTNASQDLKDALSNESSPSPKFYIQNLAGLKARFKIPSLTEKLKDKNIAINRANLILNIDPSEKDDIFLPPLHATLIRDLGDEKFAYMKYHDKNLRPGTDRNTENKNQFGVNLISGSYSFEIPFYVQDIITGNTPAYDLELFDLCFKNFPFRAVLNGSNKSDKKAKLIVYYTELK